MTRKELILSYILAELSRIENDKKIFMARFRFRSVSINDLYELLFILIREETFREFSSNILNLIKIYCTSDDLEVQLNEYLKKDDKK